MVFGYFQQSHILGKPLLYLYLDPERGLTKKLVRHSRSMSTLSVKLSHTFPQEGSVFFLSNKGNFTTFPGGSSVQFYSFL